MPLGRCSDTAGDVKLRRGMTKPECGRAWRKAPNMARPREARRLASQIDAAFVSVIWLMTHVWWPAKWYTTSQWKEDLSMLIHSRRMFNSKGTAGSPCHLTPLFKLTPPHLHFLLMAQTWAPCHWYLVFLSQAVLFASNKAMNTTHPSKCKVVHLFKDDLDVSQKKSKSRYTKTTSAF